MLAGRNLQPCVSLIIAWYNSRVGEEFVNLQRQGVNFGDIELGPNGMPRLRDKSMTLVLIASLIYCRISCQDRYEPEYGQITNDNGLKGREIYSVPLPVFLAYFAQYLRHQRWPLSLVAQRLLRPGSPSTSTQTGPTLCGINKPGGKPFESQGATPPAVIAPILVEIKIAIASHARSQKTGVCATSATPLNTRRNMPRAAHAPQPL